jgi:phosphate transport system permease protein
MSDAANPRPADDAREAADRSQRRQRIDQTFSWICVAIASVSVLVLIVLLGAIVVQGWHHLNWDFITSPPTQDVETAGVWPALTGTIWVCAICAMMALPIGVATAVLLEEFPPTARLPRMLISIIQINITNLAGVPSVVYGILGITAFVGMFGLFGTLRDSTFEIGARHFEQFLSEGDQVLLVPVESRGDPPVQVRAGMTAQTPQGELLEVHVIGQRERLPRDEQLLRRTLRSDAEGGRISEMSWYHMRLPLGRSVLAGGLTLMLVILPIVIIASQEALRAVPSSLREGAFGLGATRWQVVWNVTLPSALPGILTGSILAISRAIGEAAPILIISGVVYISSSPQHLVDSFTVLPLQIYDWAQSPQPPFHRLAASGIMVLLAILLTFNSLAIILRNRTQRHLA